jgi:hypothetical protein
MFFYHLNVATCNALVLFNEQQRISANGKQYKKWNIVQFKRKLVEELVGKSWHDLYNDAPVDEETEEHVCVPIPSGQRVKCTWCALMSGHTRTRFQCAKCGVPLCSMGSGKVKVDCFAEAHKTEERKEMVLKKHLQMKSLNPRRNSK